MRFFSGSWYNLPARVGTWLHLHSELWGPGKPERRQEMLRIRGTCHLVITEVVVGVIALATTHNTTANTAATTTATPNATTYYGYYHYYSYSCSHYYYNCYDLLFIICTMSSLLLLHFLLPLLRTIITTTTPIPAPNTAKTAGTYSLSYTLLLPICLYFFCTTAALHDSLDPMGRPERICARITGIQRMTVITSRLD